MTLLERAARERILIKSFGDPREVSLAVAAEIALTIRECQAAGRPCVLGLATGSTPMTVYEELIRLHVEEGLSFADVVTFNLDEYYPMHPEALQSYHRFMHEHLFDHIDIDPANVHIPDGMIAEEAVAEFCVAYEQSIRDAGGIDLQLLGIGRTGHIGFNEPGSGSQSRTRLITLDRTTRLDAASDFFGERHVPRRAITMGVGTILDARRICLMAFGERKAEVIRSAVEDPMTDSVAASFLQSHPDAKVFLDDAAAAALTRFRCPWILGKVDWDPEMIHAASIWLAQEIGKPLLKLTDEDYNEHSLQDLLAEHGPAYDINLAVFRKLQRTITGWPGGKPAGRKRDGDLSRTGDEIFPKTVLIFSPHPDDDVISMGGTLIRLVEQGHDVHVAYQTSGNIAVFDDDAISAADFVKDYAGFFGIEDSRIDDIDDHVEAFLRNKLPGQIDSQEVQVIKRLIRRNEARAATRACGIDASQLHFLDMPFYETGRIRKSALDEADITILTDLLETLQPHQVYAAGDLSDPHGTHRTCLAAVSEAMQRIRDRDWVQALQVWLYRGAWQEWEPERIEMAVPLSPKELQQKINAIFKHESQKDKALFPGTDSREFWQRAEERNRTTAAVYNDLGLAEYEAIEAFVQWQPGSVPMDVHTMDSEHVTHSVGKSP
ncbi:MAG: glucosamine-6-phosphate deaminase [Planctomycetota bacterium]|nr:glucosamine-6-phosphate deaminase [Planctomycetota bacterium]